MERFILIILAVVSGVHSEETVIVSTSVGDIRGLEEEFVFAGQPYNVSVFLGIPYAESTEGSRRFTKPVKKAPFDGVYDATEITPVCLQNLNFAPGLEKTSSEDCLTLNIITPSGSKQGDSKAVMIYIYGGGFQFGYQDSYLTPSLPALHDVIYVTLNYRVSVYGFLASEKYGLKGNYGLWDQHMGIKWVHDNIASFGGDPNSITIFGESAGAVSVIYQALYEGNRGLFQRVIAESGMAGCAWSYNPDPDMLYDKLAELTGCHTPDCLRNLTDSDMQTALSLGRMYLPVQDGDFIKYDPATFIRGLTKNSTDALSYFAEKDVIIGMNSDEGYSESMLFMFIFGEDLEHLNDGLTEHQMDTFAGQLLKYYNHPSDSLVLKSLRHQYTDWSDPKSAAARRANYYDMVKDFQYTVSTIQGLNVHSRGINNQGNTFMYHFERKPSFSHSPGWILGADHGDELAFVLGFPYFHMLMFGINSGDPASEVPANERMLSKDMMEYWTRFAKTGNPNDNTNGATEEWPQYDPVDQTYIRFVVDVDQYPTGNKYRNEYVNYWEEIYPIVASISEDSDREPCNVNNAATQKMTLLTFFFTFVSLYALF